MNLLANENFPMLAVDALRDAGHDVLWARTDMPGAADDAILRRAQQEVRVVLTFDKDFGELAFRSELPASCGIILFRLQTQSPEHIRARRRLRSHNHIAGNREFRLQAGFQSSPGVVL